jgi:hypothetical protein
MSDANLVVPRRPATDIDDVALGMIHLVVDAEFASLRDALSLALADNHRLTVLLAERDETIAALDALAAKLEALVAALGGRKPELRVVREEAIPSWMETKR